MGIMKTREPHTIKVRRMDFEFTPDIPDNYAADNPILSALLAALSGSFPAGERFFIDSVRHFMDEVHDPELRKRVRGFVGQEASHTKEHLNFNRFLDERGFFAKMIEERVEAGIGKLKEMSTPEQCLAHTVALEHMTAFLASAILENPELLNRMHPTVAAFWAWHAIEEIEHRSVAFDVYKAVVDDEKLRRHMMTRTTILFSLLNGYRTFLILKRRGTLTDLPAWREAYTLMFGKKGALRRTWPLFRAYYREDFHPDQHDNDAIVAAAKEKYLGSAV